MRRMFGRLRASTLARKGTLMLGVLLVGISTLGLQCGEVQPPSGRTLEMWVVFDETGDYNNVIAQYSARHPYVRVDVRKMTMDEYEQALLEGWAKGEGPDIFAMPNNYVHRFQEFLAPAPAVTTSYLLEVSGRQTNVTEQQTRMLTDLDVERFFVDTVAKDVVIDNQVYALPLSVDTLALYYNKSLLAQAGIALPAATWQEVVDHVSALSLADKDDNIIRSGIALGTTENVPRFEDILALLMVQNGAEMTTPDEKGVLFTRESVESPGYFPGVAAVSFYSDFARSSKEVYSWNDKQPDALEEFLSGNLAYFIGYSYNYNEIKTRAPGLNFDVTNMPQVSTVGRTDFANYWVYGVANSSEFQNDSWDFINFMASSDQVKPYLDATGQPTAVKGLIDAQAEDPVIGMFARQGLTAFTWYRGEDPESMEAAFEEMINLIREGELSVLEAIQNAAQKIELTL